MGFGDPYHDHPLKSLAKPPDYLDAICSRCELPIPSDVSCYGCTRCDHFIHILCSKLPKMMLHPLHDVHHLTLFEPSPSPHFSQNPSSNSSAISSTALCNECHNPCLGITYHCQTCQFFLHLKCSFTLKHAKHEHPLNLNFTPSLHYAPGYENVTFGCGVCGYPAEPLAFSCTDCKFFIHPECTHMPPTLTHRHVHELTFRRNFPEECEQVYCDLCEDKNGEMDRSLSYYYCKECDYIAHVCCVLQLREDVILFKNFSHKHPLRLASKSNNPSGICHACGSKFDDNDYNYHCNNCEHVAHVWCAQFPSSIKHPRHPEHTLTLDNNSMSFKCIDCEFNLCLSEARFFSHHLVKGNLKFGISKSMFRCSACGELGIGSRMFREPDFDLHLDCFALPGELLLDRHSSQHLLHLLSSVPPSESYILCAICQKETDPELWIYCSKESAFFAHINCVASDLLSTLRSSIRNQPDFCQIVRYDEKLFKTSFKPPSRIIQETICSSLLKHRKKSFLRVHAPFFSSFLGSEWLTGVEEDESPLLTENIVITCPECKQLISTQADACNEGSSSISGFVDELTTKNLDALTLLDEQLIDDTYCPICNVLIFPPTYSRATCQVFLHKSCANLPRKYTTGEHTYELVAPPFDDSLNNCTYCERPITGYAYLCKACGIILHVQCAVGTPLIKRGRCIFACFSKQIDTIMSCNACGNIIKEGTLMFYKRVGLKCLHIECALLPRKLEHGIHQHPLELAEDLIQYRDEYVCDVCEKDLNPLLWAYRCVDSCKGSATSHVTCLTSSKKKCHFVYNEECRTLSVEELSEDRYRRGIYGLLSDW